MSAPRNREIGFVSSSFSFRAVRAVRAVRAGEAKLCGRMWDVVLIAGPPGARIDVWSGALCVNILCTSACFLTAFDRYSSPWD